MNYQQTNGSYYSHAQNQQSTQTQYLRAQPLAYQRSCSSSNLRLYAQQQQHANYGHYTAAQQATDAMSSRSTSNLRQLAYAQQQQQAADYSSRMASRQTQQLSSQQAAQSGIVLQNLSNLQNTQPTAITNTSANKSMKANLALYSKYTQLQLQHALSQYPVWLQKEYMRRLQRQYEELYVVEDPKIHHWSAICPRVGTSNLSPTPTPRAAAAANNKENDNRYKYQLALTTNNLMGILSESASEEAASVEYLSESVTLSPSPYAYSAYNASPQKESKFAFDESIYKTSPSPQTPVEPQNNASGLWTCFQILDSMKKEETAAVCQILEEGDEDEEEEEVQVSQVQVEEIQQAVDEIHTPRMVSPTSDEDVAPAAYYAANVYQQQQQQRYQQAVQRWYQQKYNQDKQRKQQQYQQMLMQQAMQHQQYLIQQNKYVAQYINTNKVQQGSHVQQTCANNLNAQPQQQVYYAQNQQQQAQRSAYSTQQRFCA